jgi:geranylgeranyl diphosphate synthase type II
MANDLELYLQDKRNRVNDMLRSYLRMSNGNGPWPPAAGICPPELMEAMAYSLLAPGKRLRPLLVLMANEACAGDETAAMPAACAVEMVHTYSLIHDDLPAMDDDDLRRGLPTCHKKFGEATAILAGDALLTLAFQLAASCRPDAAAAACCRELAVGAGAAGMVGGQVLDLAWENRGGEFADLERIHACKTGALFRAALRMGCWTSKCDDQASWASLDAYGRYFGQLFQLTDDLIDVEGSTEQTGKRVQKDAVRGKLTYPSFLGMDESRRRATELARQACEAVAGFGDRGRRLTQLVQWVVKRDR